MRLEWVVRLKDLPTCCAVRVRHRHERNAIADTGRSMVLSCAALCTWKRSGKNCLYRRDLTESPGRRDDKERARSRVPVVSAGFEIWIVTGVVAIKIRVGLYIPQFPPRAHNAADLLFARSAHRRLSVSGALQGRVGFPFRVRARCHSTCVVDVSGTCHCT